MSKRLGQQVVIVPTALGGMTVTTDYVIEYDVEDIIRARAESQARIIQMVNVGRDVRIKGYDNKTIPSKYTDVTEDL